MAFDFIPIPERPPKPRNSGLTMAIDRGVSPEGIYDLLRDAHGFVDIIKFGWGTARLMDDGDMGRKIACCGGYRIGTMPGGTLLEIAWANEMADQFLEEAISRSFTHIEVSCGTFDLGEDKEKIIRLASGMGFRVLAEAGKKSDAWEASPEAWADEARRDLDAGAWKVILEGRESGTCGMYDREGNEKVGIVDAVLAAVPLEDVIFEAPQKKQQAQFILRYGKDVNLGNIAMNDILPLETLRLGLRGDTAKHFVTEASDATA